MWPFSIGTTLRAWGLSLLLCLPFALERAVYRFQPRALHLASGHASTPTPLIPSSFYFLAAGTQSYVFESGDLILKCFPTRNPARLQRVLDGAQIAWDRLRSETGLLYLHLHATTSLPTVTLYDRLGRPRTVDLNRIAFTLQRRATPVPHPTPAQLDSYRAFVRKRIAQCVGNSDTAFPHNAALLDGALVEIDFGEYWHHPSLADPAQAKREYETFNQKLLRWQKLHP